MQAFANAQAAVAVRMAYEAAVSDDISADEGLLKAYVAYIEFEKAGGNPSRVTLLYERAIARFPVTITLWEQLIVHLESTCAPACQ